MQLVSIIVPIYNTEQFLNRCIDSILQQSYLGIEIILVDDGSTDGCPQICDDYSQNTTYIHVVHQENKGVSGARNAGLSVANGDYVMFVDSDDELFPNAVELLLCDAEKENADIVSGEKIKVNVINETLYEDNNGEYTVYTDEVPLVLSLNGEKHTNSVCAKLFKKEFIEEISFVEGKSTNEDGFFLFQCFLKKPIMVQHNITVYKYNYRANSGSHQKFSEKYLSMLFFSEQKLQMIHENYPEYLPNAYNMEVRTNLLFLDLLCGTKDRKYRQLEKDCIKTVCDKKAYHTPIHSHHRLLSWVVAHKLYFLYKTAVRFRYYR